MLTAAWLLDKNIWIAYSGGVDSHVLLHLAATSLPQVKAVHINHGLSPNAAQWQQHCVATCAALNVPLTCLQVNAKPVNRQSPEDAARKARRKAWQQLLTADDVLLVAHHAADQAETILYRLFRGTGPKGLVGMQQVSTIGSAKLFRPLLDMSKQQILAYAQQHNLNWITDESNTNISFDRNFIRQQIIPTLSKRWPKVNANINRAGALCGQLLQVVEPVVQEKLAIVCGTDNTQLSIAKLQLYSPLWQSEILRAWLQLHGETPSFMQLNLIQQQVIAAKIDANPKYILGSLEIRRSNNKLYVISTLAKEINIEPFLSAWDLQTDLQLPNGKLLTRELIANQLGEPLVSKLSAHQLTVKLGNYGDKAKKIFQHYEIPSWQRSQYPLLLVDGKLICIVGVWFAASVYDF